MSRWRDTVQVFRAERRMWTVQRLSVAIGVWLLLVLLSAIFTDVYGAAAREYMRSIGSDSPDPQRRWAAESLIRCVLPTWSFRIWTDVEPPAVWPDLGWTIAAWVTLATSAYVRWVLPVMIAYTESKPGSEPRTRALYAAHDADSVFWAKLTAHVLPWIHITVAGAAIGQYAGVYPGTSEPGLDLYLFTPLVQAVCLSSLALGLSLAFRTRHWLPWVAVNGVALLGSWAYLAAERRFFNPTFSNWSTYFGDPAAGRLLGSGATLALFVLAGTFGFWIGVRAIAASQPGEPQHTAG